MPCNSGSLAWAHIPGRILTLFILNTMKTKLINPDIDPVEVKDPGEYLSVGQWVWVIMPADHDGFISDDANIVPGIGNGNEWFGCVAQIGSNYIEVKSPPEEHHGYSYLRIHLNDLPEMIRVENNSNLVIQQYVNFFQKRTHDLLSEVQAITAKLGIINDTMPLVHHSTHVGQALTVLNSQDNINNYKKSLITAKDVDLPKLFDELKIANSHLCKWMLAETLPLKFASGEMEDSIDHIKNRIFNVNLYAGLTEDIVQCVDGNPAPTNEKLHLMQRRLYMDEECLLLYRHGGMTFNEITEFDKWLVEDENLHRILPFPRCVVSMQVRRKTKEREAVNLGEAFINFNLALQDKLTFLYIRNGERVYRLNCDLDFGELLFPDQSIFDSDEPMMVKMFCDRVDRMMTLREYEDRLRQKEKSKQWEEDNPNEDRNPYSDWSFRPYEWDAFDKSNLYYDECVKYISDQIKKYNRVSLIVQGLFDRSEVFHPHHPVKTWTADGFKDAIELVYDGSTVLNYGNTPDFEEYRSFCNAQTTANSVMVGQHLYWMKKEAIKECDRRDRAPPWQQQHDNYRPTLFEPHGNPGPGFIAKMSRWQPTAKKAVFSWHRERLRDNSLEGKYEGSPIRTTIRVPLNELLNISAYKPGDYKQFFCDPRTRADYLKWAPFLIAAEEYHAGNLKAQEPI